MADTGLCSQCSPHSSADSLAGSPLSQLSWSRLQQGITLPVIIITVIRADDRAHGNCFLWFRINYQWLTPWHVQWTLQSSVFKRLVKYISAPWSNTVSCHNSSPKLPCAGRGLSVSLLNISRCVTIALLGPLRDPGILCILGCAGLWYERKISWQRLQSEGSEGSRAVSHCNIIISRSW